MIERFAGHIFSSVVLGVLAGKSSLTTILNMEVECVKGVGLNGADQLYAVLYGAVFL